MGRSSTNTYLRRLATGVLFLLVASSIMVCWPPSCRAVVGLA
jgi:hypothetical protein